MIFVVGGVDEADEGVLHLAKEHFRSLVDICSERVSPKSENMKTVGDYALEYESDGVLQLTCFTEQVGGSFVAFDPETVTRCVCKYISKQWSRDDVLKRRTLICLKINAYTIVRP